MSDEDTARAAEHLLGQGASPNASKNFPRSHRGDALSQAAIKGKQKSALLLISAGANARVSREDESNHLIFHALNEGMLDLAAKLAPSLNMDARNKSGKTPWMAALRFTPSAEDLAPFLPKHPLDQKDLDQSILLAAATSPQLASLTSTKILLSMGANPSAKDRDSMSALMTALSSLNEDTALALIDAGADIHTETYRGDSAFSWAAIRGSERVLRRLAPLVDVNQRHRDGRTPLVQALEYDSHGYADGGICFLLEVSDLNLRFNPLADSPEQMDTPEVRDISLWELAESSLAPPRAMNLLKLRLLAKGAEDEAHEISTHVHAATRGRRKTL